MATASTSKRKRKSKKSKKSKTASQDQAMTAKEFNEKLKSLTPATQKRVKKYMEGARPGGNARGYGDESITKDEFTLNNAIVRFGGSRRMGDYVLNMTRRRGMSSQDLSHKRTLRSCVA